MSPKPIKKRKKVIRIREYFQWVFPAMISVFLAFLVVQIFGNVMLVEGDSMAPTYKKGDFVLVSKLSYRFKKPERNDIVVFDANLLDTSRLHSNAHYTLSRIVGLPGETIQIQDEALYIDDEKFDSPYIKESILQSGLELKPVKLGENEYFVLGDNCNFSQDSRFANIGNIKQDAMLGKVLTRK